MRSQTYAEHAGVHPSIGEVTPAYRMKPKILAGGSSTKDTSPRARVETCVFKVEKYVFTKERDSFE